MPNAWINDAGRFILQEFLGQLLGRRVAFRIEALRKMGVVADIVELSSKVRQELAAKGHKIEVMGAFSTAMGGGQAVMRDSLNGVNYGASDPRKDGAALPELPTD